MQKELHKKNRVVKERDILYIASELYPNKGKLSALKQAKKDGLISNAEYHTVLKYIW